MDIIYIANTFKDIAYAFVSLPFIFALLFMLLDVVTGLVKAFATKSFSSSKMREGFFHKMSIIIILVVAAVADAFIVTGVGSIGIEAPVFKVACVYIVIMELASILENVSEINPNLANSKLLQLFAGVHDASKEAK